MLGWGEWTWLDTTEPWNPKAMSRGKCTNQWRDESRRWRWSRPTQSPDTTLLQAVLSLASPVPFAAFSWAFPPYTWFMPHLLFSLFLHPSQVLLLQLFYPSGSSVISSTKCPSGQARCLSIPADNGSPIPLLTSPIAQYPKVSHRVVLTTGEDLLHLQLQVGQMSQHQSNVCKCAGDAPGL